MELLHYTTLVAKQTVVPVQAYLSPENFTWWQRNLKHCIPRYLAILQPE
jgi:hypothetical protein